MNIKTTLLILFFIFFFKNALSQTTIIDNFNGSNTVASLQSRGWIVVDNDGGGTVPAWFQGNSSVFTSLEGPDSGYVGSNFLGSNSSGLVDQWLITPLLTVSMDDTLFFWARSAQQSGFNDSIFVFYNSTGSTSLANYQFLFGAKLDINNWTAYFVHFGSTGTFRIAIRYFVNNAPMLADYIGLDLFEIHHKLNYPATITLNNTFSFNGLNTSNYRMIGIPGNQTTKISDMITGTQKKDWDAFYDNGSASNFLQEFDGSSVFNFSAGKGFWILSKNPFTVNATVNTVSIAADNTFKITLHQGFNIISDPFEKSVSWADIQNLNGLNTNDILFDWSGVWTHATQMDPYKAYYFNNTNNLQSLKIPYNFAAAKNSARASYENYPGNFIKLSLIQKDQVKSYTVAGFDKSAKKDYDKYDIFAPPGYFDEVRINIEDQNISDPYKHLSVDYRPGVNEGQSFDLMIKNTTKQAVKLIADGMAGFSNYEVYLLDKNLNKFYNLKEQNEISFTPVHEKYDFQLLIGGETYINNVKKGDLPAEYTLFQNYPNPFNPSTLIKYQIRDNNTIVELKVFNILGKEVKTLLNEVQDSGTHEVEFNASDFSSGVYFYTLKASSYTATKKMILIK